MPAPCRPFNMSFFTRPPASTSWMQLSYCSITCNKYWGVGFMQMLGHGECGGWVHVQLHCCSVYPLPSCGFSTPHDDPVNDGITCTQILNLHPGEHWALSGKGPRAGKIPLRHSEESACPPFPPDQSESTQSRLWRKADAGTGCTPALCGLLSLFLPLPLGTAVCPLGERLCSPSTVPRTTWEPPPNKMPFLRSLSNLLCSISSSPINNVAVRLDYSPLPSLSQLKILVVSYSVRRDI